MMEINNFSIESILEKCEAFAGHLMEGMKLVIVRNMFENQVLSKLVAFL